MFFNNFGHKDVNCRAYVRGRNTWNRNGYENFRNHDEEPHKEFDRSYNKSGALNYEIECYKCNNFGSITKNCISGMPVLSKETRSFLEQKRTWVKKQKDLHIDECGIALQDQRSIIQWCVDSGCSKHMIGDKKNCIIKKIKGGIYNI